MSPTTADRVRVNLLRALYKESQGHASNVGGVWACSVCGCLDVQIAAWRIVNTGEVTEDEGPCDDLWCPSCETHRSESSACVLRINDGRVVCTECIDCRAPDLVHRYPFTPVKAEKART